MRTKLLLISCLLVFVFGCNLFSNASALIFDIGTKISESDPTFFNDQFYYYSSGSTLHTHMDYKDDIQLLFDNNTNTAPHTHTFPRQERCAIAKTGEIPHNSDLHNFFNRPISP